MIDGRKAATNDIRVILGECGLENLPVTTSKEATALSSLNEIVRP